VGVVNSFIAANTIPAKLIGDVDVVSAVTEHKIPPVHVQINPTNKCPFSCRYCSMANMDRGIEMSWPDIVRATDSYIALGTRAFTITGGGDPLAYTWINDVVARLHRKGCDIGLVTNAMLFRRFDPKLIKCLTWCRVSVSDESVRALDVLPEYLRAGTDWAFSYVLTAKPNIMNIIRVVEFANNNHFTHVRLVDDILESGGLSRMDIARAALAAANVDDSLVIYQGRKQYVRGHSRCMISLLKPNISADGLVVGCCGTQYASDPPALNYTKEFSIGTISDINDVYHNQKYFDGSACSRCYYSEYNDVLNMLWDYGELKHRNFI